MNKNTMIIGGGMVIGLLILLLVFVWLMTILKPKYYNYYEAEELISAATEKYYKKNPEELPAADGKYTFNYDTLVDNDYIKPLNKILKDGDECRADILVNKSGTEYDYITKLDCGENYRTKEFYSQILQDHEVVATGSGLYKDGSEYYFRGKIDDNYVVFGSIKERKETKNLLWQIMSIDEYNNVKLKANFATEKSTKWDDRYNNEKKSYNGYNGFEESVIKDYLKKLETDASVLDETHVSKLVGKQLCIAARNSKDDSSKDGTTECSILSNEKYLFGTITPFEYMRASIDEQCNSLSNRSCSNFNYLAKVLDEGGGWTLTPVPATTDQIYVFDGRSFSTETAKSKRNIYLTINLSPYVYYRSGTGTESDPYIIR